MSRFQQIRHALGSEAALTLMVEDEALAAKLFTGLWDQIEAFEGRFSRFKTDSELNALNARAGERFPISREMHDLLAASQRYAAQTSGLFNPFILPSLQQAGYKGSWPTPEQGIGGTDYSARKVETYTSLHLEATWASIPPGSALEFGGIGKGYLLDQLADWLEPRAKNFWLSLGGDIICAGHDLNAQAWAVGVQAAGTDKIVETLVNITGDRLAIATSGITKRKGRRPGGQKWHHIIDPRTGLPADTDILTATVTASSATAADIYAKCAVILGSHDALTFLNDSTTVQQAILQVASPQPTPSIVRYTREQL